MPVPQPDSPRRQAWWRVRAVTSISIFMRGSARPQTCIVAAGRTSPKGVAGPASRPRSPRRRAAGSARGRRRRTAPACSSAAAMLRRPARPARPRRRRSSWSRSRSRSYPTRRPVAVDDRPRVADVALERRAGRDEPLLVSRERKLRSAATVCRTPPSRACGRVELDRGQAVAEVARQRGAQRPHDLPGRATTSRQGRGARASGGRRARHLAPAGDGDAAVKRTRERCRAPGRGDAGCFRGVRPGPGPAPVEPFRERLLGWPRPGRRSSRRPASGARATGSSIAGSSSARARRARAPSRAGAGRSCRRRNADQPSARSMPAASRVSSRSATAARPSTARPRWNGRGHAGRPEPARREAPRQRG